jgi:integrase
MSVGRPPVARDPKHLTVWQAWTYLVDKSRLAKSVRRTTEDALKIWERFSADPILSAVSLSTLKQFRELGRKAGLSDVTMRTHQQRVVKIIRQFRPLELPGRGDITTEDKQLTIREAFAKFYVPAAAGLSPATHRKRKHDFNWWERFTPDNPPIGKIDTEVFDEVRRKGLEAGLSNVTIESLISDVLTVLRHLHHTKILSEVPWAGKRLKRRPVLKPTPSIDALSKVYAVVPHVTWPVYKRRLICPHGKFTRAQRVDRAITWWKGLFALAYFSGLRRKDLLTLKWDEVQDGWIRRRMEKTQFTVEIPIHPCLKTHLDDLRTKDGPEVLGYLTSFKQIRREMHALAAIAGVNPLLLNIQALRRLSAQQFEEARPGAGGLLLGHVYRTVDRHYLNPTKALEQAIPRLLVPKGMGEQPALPEEPSTAATPSALLQALQGIGREELAKLLVQALSGAGVPV